MWGQDGWRSHRLVSYRARYLRFRYILFFYAPIQVRISFETFFGVEGVESRRGHVLRSLVTYVGPLCFTTTRYHRQVPKQDCGAAASVRAGIPHPFKCAAAALRLLSHPLLSHPQTRPVGVRTFYHTPFLSPPLIITPPNTPCGCSDVLSHTLVYHTPLGPPASFTLSPRVHNISHPLQDPTPGDNIFKSQNRGVLSCVSYGRFMAPVRIGWLLLLLLFSHINSCQKSRVRGHTKVLEP